MAVVGEDGGGATGESLAAGTPAGHVHGLGVNPKDGALFVATHSGLFRAAEGQTRPERVGDSDQDIMGFTVAGPDRFLGSGHPGSDQGLPPLLGLIESSDGGRSWKPVSLLGEADFHVLRSARGRVYGFDSASGRLLASPDGGGSFEQRDPPEPLLDLAIDPRDPERLVAASDAGLRASANGGRTWRRLGGQIALLAWPTPERLFLLDAQGSVKVSADGGRRFRATGRLDGEPVALMADGQDLYVALAGAVLHSSDEGASWTIRASL